MYTHVTEGYNNAMFRKTAILLLIIITSLFTLSAAAVREQERAKSQEDLSIVHVTDPHYLSPEITDYSDHFMAIVENADGKVTHLTPQLTDAFVRDMLILKPDAVIISGDLTLNGAEESHKGFAKALLPMAEAGIKVFVIPGNHDTDGTSYVFRNGKTYQKDSIESEDFPDIYSESGYGDAVSRDEYSLSYFGKISDALWVLMVDVNANGTFCTVKNETLKWMEENLKKAKAEGIRVISSTHQPMSVHNSRFTFGYTVSNANKVMELYGKYGVELNLAGHLHIQHINHEDGFTDIAASSLAVSPNQYGIITIRNNRPVSYETRSVDVSSWAEENGIMLSSLLNFSDYSADFFDRTTLSKLNKAFSENNLTDEETERLKNIAAKINREYFEGKATVTEDDEDWILWQEKMNGISFGSYMGTIVSEAPYDMTRFDFPVTK